MEKLTDLFFFQNDVDSFIKKLRLITSAVLIVTSLELAYYILEVRGYEFKQFDLSLFPKHFIAPFLILFSVILGGILYSDMIILMITSRIYKYGKIIFKIPAEYPGWKKEKTLVEREQDLINLNQLLIIFRRLTIGYVSLTLLYFTIVRNEYPNLYFDGVNFITVIILMTLWGSRDYGSRYRSFLEKEISSLKRPKKEHEQKDQNLSVVG